MQCSNGKSGEPVHGKWRAQPEGRLHYFTFYDHADRGAHSRPGRAAESSRRRRPATPGRRGGSRKHDAGDPSCSAATFVQRRCAQRATGRVVHVSRGRSGKGECGDCTTPAGRGGKVEVEEKVLHYSLRLDDEKVTTRAFWYSCSAPSMFILEFGTVVRSATFFLIINYYMPIDIVV